MRIRFNYNGSRRSGELVAQYTASNGNLIAKVREDGEENPKSFTVARMSNVESGPLLTDAELLPLLKVAADNLQERMTERYRGNSLELLLAAVYNGRIRIDVLVGSAEEAIKWAKDKAGV